MSRILACLLSAASLGAQTSPCHARNGVSSSIGSALTAIDPNGPNSFAFRTTLGPSGSLQALAICTGNTVTQPGFMKLEVWYDDPVTNLPLRRWCGGTWQISPALGVAWQGTNLDLDLAGVSWPVWIVWTEPGGSFEPYEPGGATVPTAQLVNGVWTQVAPAAPKLRFYCGYLDGRNVTLPGSPNGRCWGTGGFGTLFTNQPPSLGNAAFAFEGTNFLPNTIAMLVLGTNPNGLAAVPGLPGGCAIRSAADVIVWRQTGGGDVRAGAGLPGAAGHVWFPAPLPANPSLRGLLVTAVAGAWDPGVAWSPPFVVAPPVHVTLF